MLGQKKRSGVMRSVGPHVKAQPASSGGLGAIEPTERREPEGVSLSVEGDGRVHALGSNVALFQ